MHELKRTSRIIAGKYFAEITQDPAGNEAFHWFVRKLDTLDVMVIGEQVSYETALLEAEQSLIAVAEADRSGDPAPQHHAAGA